MSFFGNKLPPKPPTQKEQVSFLWDILTNHIWHRLAWQDMKINFVLVLLGLILGLLALAIAK